jgi:hypothetical protein
MRPVRNLHLPDASRGAAGRPGKLSSMCGMALEPAEITLDQEPECGRALGHDDGASGSAARSRCRSWRSTWAATCSGLHVFELHGPVYAHWIELLFATPVVLWAGWPLPGTGRSVGEEPCAQHVQPDRSRHMYGVALQSGRHCGPRPLPRRAAGLFRSRLGDRRAGVARPSAGAACPRRNLGRDQGAVGPGAAYGAACDEGRRR